MPCQINLTSIKEFFYQKDDERNLISAAFHMMTITLISMSLGDLTWFKIDGHNCVPYLTLGQFFWFGYSDVGVDFTDLSCLDGTLVNLMRIIILMCFMAILFSLMGFFLDVIGPKALLYRMLRRYSVAGTATVLFIMSIITMSYYVIVLLQNAIESEYPRTYYDISYGFGFYLVTIAGGVEALGLLYTLILPYRSSYQEDDRCLMDGFDDMSHFESPTPPPPYSVLPPPPPYTP
ncbi:transmembrane protein 127-like [Anthonomus grandis grandis]|uniref:transmembrane protein 127-like n=1 Tax=Anthonomus grandis grandis TaxID=2921223 RepID=UPI0021668CF3|nr:transmembrane protein 127-like [Anthonomus grandis grandis]XP_050294282.1 transmembrane protein 127-like [Anthonomus grandis grandis]